MTRVNLQNLLSTHPCTQGMEDQNWRQLSQVLNYLDDILQINIDENNQITYQLVNLDSITVNDLTVNNDATIGNDLTVTNDLTVNNDATVGNDLTVNNDATVVNDFSVTNGDVTIDNGDINVTTGTVYAPQAYITTIQGGTATYNTIVGGDVTVNNLTAVTIEVTNIYLTLLYYWATGYIGSDYYPPGYWEIDIWDCCPTSVGSSGSGSGGGGGDCDGVPSTLTATITGNGNCSGSDSVTLTLSASIWSGYSSVFGMSLSLACEGGNLTLSSTGCPSTDNIKTPLGDFSLDPIDATFFFDVLGSDLNCPACSGSGGITVEITA